MVGTRGDLKVSPGFGELQIPAQEVPVLCPAAFLQECEKPDLEGAEIACSLNQAELSWLLLLPSTSPNPLQTQLHAVYPHQAERSTGWGILFPGSLHGKGVHPIQGSLVTWQSALGCT